MVLDINQQGFPIVFLFSNRETEGVSRLFFEAIKLTALIIKSNSFLSDMAPQLYNAWQFYNG